MKRFLRHISFFLAALSITGVIGLALILEPCIKIHGFTELDENRLNNIKNTLVIYDSDGTNKINKIQYTPLSEISNKTVNAFLCAEDRRFYSHEGIDYFRILSAMIKDIKDGAFSQGASTITQQFIKNSHLNNEKSLSRKVQEVRLSRALERKYSKDEILEMYLNILYFGNSIYGIGNAARNFFDKEVYDLTLRESAMLAAIINNPARYNPYDNYDNLNKRTNMILKSMQKYGKISNNQFKEALSEKISVKELSLCDKYRFYLIKEACDVLGCDEEFLLHSNLKIVSNCNNELQTKISQLISRYNEDIFVVVIDNNTGEIIAHEARYKGDPSGIFSSPGSIIKPIACYAPAIEKNMILPITPILDEKTDFGGYSPSNYKDEYNGWVSCKFALKESLNVPAVKLIDYVGLDYAKKFTQKMGIDLSEEEGLALALGGMKYGTNLEDLAGAYSVFARGGNKIDCSHIKAIYMDDKLIYSPSKVQTRIMREETAYFINEMLEECAHSGTAKILRECSHWAAKTGTVGNANGNSDAYCIAYSPLYTIGVHIKQHNGYITGGGLPTKIAKQLIMSNINSDVPFNIPASIVKIEINSNEYYKNQKIVAAEKTLPIKDKISASFPIYNLPPIPDERGDYEKGLDFFDMNDFSIVNRLFD